MTSQSKFNQADGASDRLLDGSLKFVVDFGKISKKVLHKNHFLNFLLALGFEKTDLRMLHLKIDYRAMEPQYAWVAFASHELAVQAMHLAATEGLEVAWVKDWLQNMKALKKHFKSNSIMHGSVPLHLQPCLYQDGEEVLFPELDPNLKPPKQVLKHMPRFLRVYFPDGPPAVKKTFTITPYPEKIEVVRTFISTIEDEDLQPEPVMVLGMQDPREKQGPVAEISRATIYTRAWEVYNNCGGQVGAWFRRILNMAERHKKNNSWS